MANRTSEPAPTSIFEAGTNWLLLTQQDETFDDPNSGTSFHAPTPNFVANDIQKDINVVMKRNYAQVFKRPPFIGSVEVDMVDKFKRRRVDKTTKKVMKEKIPVGDGGIPRPEFLRERRLDCHSLPHE